MLQAGYDQLLGWRELARFIFQILESKDRNSTRKAT